MEIVLYGIIGGIFAEILGLFKMRRSDPNNLPNYLSSKFYWTITFLMVLSGGAITFIYMASGIQVDPIIAVNIGASAPLIIGNIVSGTPNVGRID